MVVVVHYVVVDGPGVRPLCGAWAGSPNWTRIASTVTCARCLELLQRREV